MKYRRATIKLDIQGIPHLEYANAMDSHLQRELAKCRASLAQTLNAINLDHAARGLSLSDARIRAAKEALAAHHERLTKRLLAWAYQQPNSEEAHHIAKQTLATEYRGLCRNLEDTIGSTGNAAGNLGAAMVLMERARYGTGLAIKPQGR